MRYRQQINVELQPKKLHCRNYISVNQVSTEKFAMTFLQASQIFLQLLETTLSRTVYNSSCILSASQLLIKATILASELRK